MARASCRGKGPKSLSTEDTEQPRRPLDSRSRTARISNSGAGLMRTQRSTSRWIPAKLTAGTTALPHPRLWKRGLRAGRGEGPPDRKPQRGVFQRRWIPLSPIVILPRSRCGREPPDLCRASRPVPETGLRDNGFLLIGCPKTPGAAKTGGLPAARVISVYCCNSELRTSLLSQERPRPSRVRGP